MQNNRYPNIKSQNDKRSTNCRKTDYFILFTRNVLVDISLSFATSCSALSFLFLPSGFKTLRQELSDALQFMRRSAPLNYEPCLSQALSFIP